MKNITITTIRSRKGNPFLVIGGGRSFGLPPWLTAEEAQGVLDNIDTVRAFIAENRNKRPLTVVPRPVAPVVEPQREPAPAPALAVVPQPAAPTPPDASEPSGPPRAPAQTDITTNINPKVAALVARAMGTKPRRFSSVA